VLLVTLAIGAFGCERERARFIKEATTAERPELRAHALARLGEMKREEDFPLFLKATHDSSSHVRRASAECLGRSNDPKAIDPLGELLGDGDEEVAAAAARALSGFNTDKSRAYLLAAYRRGSGPTRAAIAGIIGPSLLAEAIRHEAKQLWERNLKALESGGPAERVGAAEELGRSGRGDAVERLLPLLGNDSVLLAAGAARGLGAARDRRAVAPLIGVLKENFPVLREAAAEALGSLGDGAAAAQPLEKLAIEGGPSAVAAVRALGQLARGDEARRSLCNLAATAELEIAVLCARLARDAGGCPPEPFLARLNKGGGETRAALAALENLGGEAGMGRIVLLLDDTDPGLRLAAARALAELKAPAAQAKVEKWFTSESERIVTARSKWVKELLPHSYAPTFEPLPEGEAHSDAALDHEGARKLGNLLSRVDALAKAQAERAGVAKAAERAQVVPEAVDDLGPDEESFLGALAVAAGNLRLTAVLPHLSRLAGDANERLRASACEGVGAMGTPEALALAGRCLDDPAGAVLRATARGLRRSGPSAAATLLAGLERRRSERTEILRALGVLQSKEASAKIVALLAAGGIEGIEAAVALGRIGEASATGALVEHLKDPRTQARREVIVALGQVADPSASLALERELYHERPEIRAASARALGRIGRGAGAASLDALRSDYFAEVRTAAEESLGKVAGETPAPR
jgi:HEAT repeat protein